MGPVRTVRERGASTLYAHQIRRAVELAHHGARAVVIHRPQRGDDGLCPAVLRDGAQVLNLRAVPLLFPGMGDARIKPPPDATIHANRSQRTMLKGTLRAVVLNELLDRLFYLMGPRDYLAQAGIK